MRQSIAGAAIVAACLMAGCQRDPTPDTRAGTTGDRAAALPQPEAGAGSVTGFDGSSSPPTNSAPASVLPDDAAIAATPDPDAPVSSEPGDTAGFDLGPPATTDPGSATVPATPPQAPAPPPAATAPPQPDAAEAAAVVRSYYGAINAGQYPRAYALWGDGGGASGQSAAQFAGGFSDTAQVTANTGQPGRVEGAAGSRYVTVPVAVEAVHHDGSIHHYDGTFTLRRSVVDGASAEQRAWRISDADLRAVE